VYGSQTAHEQLRICVPIGLGIAKHIGAFLLCLFIGFFHATCAILSIRMDLVHFFVREVKLSARVLVQAFHLGGRIVPKSDVGSANVDAVDQVSRHAFVVGVEIHLRDGHFTIVWIRSRDDAVLHLDGNAPDSKRRGHSAGDHTAKCPHVTPPSAGGALVAQRLEYSRQRCGLVNSHQAALPLA
jgi:hypothetical protein